MQLELRRPRCGLSAWLTLGLCLCAVTCTNEAPGGRDAGLADGGAREGGLPDTGAPDARDGCGDGVVDGLEECDDGNATDWDGCTDCRITEFKINADSYDNSQFSSVAVGVDNHFFVVWRGCYDVGLDASSCSVYGRLLDAQASFLTTDVSVPSGVEHDAIHTDAAALDGGGWVVAWTRYRPNEGELLNFAQRHDASGAALGASLLLDPQSGPLWEVPSVAPSSLGGFVALWSRREPSSDGLLLGQHFWLDGTRDGSGFALEDPPAAGGVAPRLDRAADGTIVAVWENCSGLDGEHCGVFGRLFHADGAPATARFQVNTYTPSSQRFPDVAVAPDGHFLVVWNSNEQQGAYREVYAQHYAPDGAPLGAEQPVNTLTEERQNFPAVAAAPDGTFMVVWEDHNDQYGSGGNVLARRYLTDGSPAGEPFGVNQNRAETAVLPAIAATSTGGFVVVWSAPDDSQEHAVGIFGQRFDAAGNALGVGP